jgi:hypothetical protein
MAACHAGSKQDAVCCVEAAGSRGGEAAIDGQGGRKVKRTLLMVFVVVLVLGFAGPLAWADPVVWDVYEGESIQAAIDAASDGDIVYVHEGTYDESVVIDGVDVSLIAGGPVTIQPTSACAGHGDVIQVYNGVYTIEGFTIDANYSVSDCLGGIYARGGCESPGHVDVTVRDNRVSNYGKNGITVNCELAMGEITDNVVTGRGPLLPGDFAQNGIQLGWGATGAVRGNTITDHWYVCSKKDAAQGICTYWLATGLLLYDVEPGLIKHAKNDNTFRRNQFDVLVVSSNSLD